MSGRVRSLFIQFVCDILLEAELRLRAAQQADHGGDVFDEHLGQKIAMARLEAKAYARFQKTLDRWISRFNDFIDSLGIMYRDFTSRAANASEHDLRYIQDISTTATEKSGLQ